MSEHKLREQARALLTDAVMDDINDALQNDDVRLVILDTLQPLFDQMARELRESGAKHRAIADVAVERHDQIVELTAERDDLRAKLTQAQS